MDSRIIDLSKYRLEQAKSCIKSLQKGYTPFHKFIHFPLSDII